MRKLPRLPRQIVHKPEDRERELWQPRWKCFCCHDSGFIDVRLVQLVIPDYDPAIDALPLCHAGGCEASSWAVNASDEVTLCLDWRFIDSLCNELDWIAREWWKEAVQRQFDQMRQVEAVTSELADKMSLRSRDRTLEEQQLAEQGHQAVMERVNEEVA